MMQLVMGGLNRVWLTDLLDASKVCCRTIRAAVAYAQEGHRLFEHCKGNDVRLIYYGLLDEGDAVPVRLLEHFLDRGPSRVQCKLIKGCFHPKVIWWHGFGAYVGSANLTDKAWMQNVECGVFFDESELGGGIGRQLEQMFDYLDSGDVSVPLSPELIGRLKRLQAERAGVYKAEKSLKDTFDRILQDIPAHRGLPFTPGRKEDGRRRDAFLSEWRQTLELMRGLRRDFEALKLRPSWVRDDAHGATHFDQFLHAYYYQQVIGADDEEGKSIERVERFYDRNRDRVVEALREAAEWWASLGSAPDREDEFISSHAPRIRNAFAPEALDALTEEALPDALRHVNAFRMHARQTKNVELGLPADFRTTIDERVDLLARWLWRQRTVVGNHSLKDALRFVLWGTNPREMEHRLWLAIDSDEWSIPHFGRSCFGELVGWARPDDYPPRNNRTNKALRSLGHNVKLFFAE